MIDFNWWSETRRGMPNQRDLIRQVLASPYFNMKHYSRSARRLFLSPAAAARHYVKVGERRGLSPSPQFDPVFYRNNYLDLADWSDPLLLHYTKYGAIEGRLGRSDCTQLKKSEVHDLLLGSRYFDPIFYAHQVGQTFGSPEKALRHYLNAGEAMDARPSPFFDPALYRSSYPDLANYRPLLLHYVAHGHQEGRVGHFDFSGMIQPGDRLHDPDKPTLILAAHEASMTGAPILAYNLAHHLAVSSNVIFLTLRDGPLTSEARKVSTQLVVGSQDFERLAPNIMAERLLRPLADRFGVDALIASSVETEVAISAAHLAQIPALALVHEFATYVAPIRLYNVLKYSQRVVFSSALTERSARDAKVVGTFRHSTVIPQGKSRIPANAFGEEASAELADALDGVDGVKLLCIGCGYVQFRKGVDLFIAVAAAVARRLGPNEIRFVWVGDGYDPIHDRSYSTWLNDQIERSGLQDVVRFVPALGAEELEGLYRNADVMLLSSRLDPFPNVAIDAIHAGLPVVCFEQTTGVAEYLRKKPDCAVLAVDYLDIEGAAAAIAAIGEDRQFKTKVAKSLQELASEFFEMPDYVDKLTDLVGEVIAIADQERRDVDTIVESGLISRDMVGPPALATFDPDQGVKDYVCLSSAHVNREDGAMRRPVIGFSPTAYEEHHPELDASPFPNSLAHWIEAGRPEGPWTHAVITLTEGAPAEPQQALRAALHIHLHYPEFAEDVLRRIEINDARPELLISVTSDEALSEVAEVFGSYSGKATDIRVVPNRGRDVGSFLVEFRDRLREFDMVGHLHGKKSVTLDSGTAEPWRNFLYETMIGGKYRPIDQILGAFQSDPTLGLVFPEDPHIVGWTKNLAFAEALAPRLGLSTLPKSIEFPVGNMFFARTAAISAMFDAGFTWDDMPEEPVPYDGSVLHALERLTSVVVEKAGYRYAGVYAPGVAR